MFNKDFIRHLECEIAYLKAENKRKDEQIQSLIDKFVFHRRTPEIVTDNGTEPIESAIPEQKNKKSVVKKARDRYSMMLAEAEQQDREVDEGLIKSHFGIDEE